MLIRAAGGEQKVWSVVKVPAPAAEDQRQVHRELLFARRDRGRHTNRITGRRASQGVPLERIHELPEHLVRARLRDGTPLPALLGARLTREWETVLGYTARIGTLKTERRALLKATDDPAMAQVRELHQLRGVGIDSAWLYVMACFAWREFRNRRQVGGLAGLTDTHYQSGDLQHEQGISKAGIAGSARLGLRSPASTQGHRGGREGARKLRRHLRVRSGDHRCEPRRSRPRDSTERPVGKHELLAETPVRFFQRGSKITITFEGDGGRIDRLVLASGGQRRTATRRR